MSERGASKHEFRQDMPQVAGSLETQEGGAQMSGRKEQAGIAGRLLMAPIIFYRRFISPLKATPSCRFHPTCSAYALESIRVHGALRGSFLAVKRVLKCHPFHPGGLDPVPPRHDPRERPHQREHPDHRERPRSTTPTEAS